MNTYKSFSHAKTMLRYHLIFSTKYRKDCLTKIHDSVILSFREVEKISDFKILEIELDKNHIHILIEFRPRYSIEQVVRRLKQMTTSYIWKKNESWLRQFYWSGKHILWTGGYFCSTIGSVSEEKLKYYIKNQG